MTEVTQEDREAAADFWRKIPNMAFAEWQEGWMRDGAGDNGTVVQAFSAHRIASDRAGYERGQRETVARIVAWLRGIGFGDEDQNRAKFEIMKAIEAGEWE